jgi:hypothetical protein
MVSLPPWSVVQPMLLAVVLPGFAVGAGVLAGVCALTRSETGRLIGGAAALAGGLAVGNFTRGLLPWWSLEPGWPSLFPATVVALCGVVVAVVADSRANGRLGLGLRIIAVAGSAWWLTPAGTLWPRLGFFALMVVGVVLNWEAFRCRGGRSLGRNSLLLVTAPWCVAAAVVLIHAHSARFCDLAMLLAAAIAGVGFVASLRKLDIVSIFAGPAVFVPALMLAGGTNTFSEVPAASFILVALAPSALWSLQLPPMRRWSGRALAAAGVVAVLIPCAVAIILAMRAETLDFGG